MKALFDRVMRVMRESSREALPLQRALERALYRALGSPVQAPGSQVVIYTCASGGTASRETRDGEIPASDEEVGEALEDAEIVDVRDVATPAATEATAERPTAATRPPAEPGRRRRRAKTIPPAVRARVIARDRGRCRTCGSDTWRHIHHADPNRNDEAILTLLCSGCHRLVHRGVIVISGTGPDFAFTRGGASPLPVIERRAAARRAVEETRAEAAARVAGAA